MYLGKGVQRKGGKGGGKGTGVVMESTSVTRIREDTKVIMVNSACKRVRGGARGTGAGLAQGTRVTRRAAIARKGGREAAYHALLPFPVRHPLSEQSL